jgi:hypothetical protein
MASATRHPNAFFTQPNHVGVFEIGTGCVALRAKLETVPANPPLLLTEPGVGYRLAETQV